MQAKPNWYILGILGVAPFVLILILSFFDSLLIEWRLSFVFSLYSACIVSFLAGTIWLGEQQPQKFGPTLISNVITLLAFCAVLFDVNVSVFLLISCYLIVLFAEFYFDLFDNKPDGYKMMRVSLTSAVIICHTLMWLVK